MELLCLSLLFDVLLGEAPARLHPVCFFGRWAEVCEHTVRSFLGNGRLAGTVAALLAVGPFVLFSGAVVHAVSFFEVYEFYGKFQPATVFAAAVIVYVCLALRSLLEHARAVRQELAHNNLTAARLMVGRMVGRDTYGLSAHAVARAGVESVGENLVDGVLATLFWAGVGMSLAGAGGLSGPCWAAGLAVLHRGFNTLDAMWGKRTERYARFGTFAARMDDVLAFVPARLSLPVIALAALSLSGRPPGGLAGGFLAAQEALRVGWRDHAALASPNSGWSEAAFAGALGLRLGGTLSYQGVVREAPFLGEGTPLADARHLHLAEKLAWRTTLLFVLGLILCGQLPCLAW